MNTLHQFGTQQDLNSPDFTGANRQNGHYWDKNINQSINQNTGYNQLNPAVGHGHLQPNPFNQQNQQPNQQPSGSPQQYQQFNQQNQQFGQQMHNQPHQSQPNNFNQQQSSQQDSQSDSGDYYTRILLVAIIGLCFYYVGASLIIFFKNLGTGTVVTLNSYEVSWELLFNDFPLFLKNFFSTIFGYFIQYGRLFGFFEQEGQLSIEVRPKHMMPVDIMIKAATIAYFHFYWMNWDTKKMFQRGCFNSKYPFLSKANKQPEKQPDQNQNSIDFSTAANMEKPTSYHNGVNTQIENNQIKTAENDDDDDDDDDEFLPFQHVAKPLEEWYYKNEEKVYMFLRTQLIPGSNLILALYASTMFVLDLRNPIYIILYFLLIMSIFWCMQSFLMLLDHTQFQPEEDLEEKRD